MANVYLGIDPGKKGAFALMDDETLRVTCYDMPATTKELHDFVVGLPAIKACVLEQLHAGPQMGRTTVAAMFENYGALKGALAWRDIRFTTVRPNKWKPAMNLSKDKSASREKAMQLFPNDAEQFKRVKDDGRAEAALLANWAMQKS